ncbi:hypothetical protein DPMN_010193 [Dreissena polymorpha]|uniref:Uncharacterized protein n=1 Tax=Dreissena polymorpha TaxID=45954 RepID=A0A9D4MYC9_DREPO|nr:hypothetical protein DPMN_010193 [Dreissena polymorpha]
MSCTFLLQGHLLVTVQADKTTFSCYIGTLTDAEHAQIHTDAGMRAVEVGE